MRCAPTCGAPRSGRSSTWRSSPRSAKSASQTLRWRPPAAQPSATGPSCSTGWGGGTCTCGRETTSWCCSESGGAGGCACRRASRNGCVGAGPARACMGAWRCPPLHARPGSSARLPPTRSCLSSFLLHYAVGGQFARFIRLNQRLHHTSLPSFLLGFWLSSTLPWQARGAGGDGAWGACGPAAAWRACWLGPWRPACAPLMPAPLALPPPCPARRRSTAC